MRSILLVAQLILVLQLGGDTVSVAQPADSGCSCSVESTAYTNACWREILGLEFVISVLVRVSTQKD